MQVKWWFLLLLIMGLVISGTVNGADFGELEAEGDLETNLVLLEIRAQEKRVAVDPFFEIFVFVREQTEGPYVLLPLNSLAPYFDLAVNFQRAKNLIIVSHVAQEREVKIDLAAREYINQPEWKGEPPLVFAGDFFVSAQVIEYLFGVQVVWDPSYQELIISGDYFLPEPPTETDKQNKIDSDGQIEEAQRPVVMNKADFSLGSLQYKVGSDYRWSEEDVSQLVFRKDLNLHGRLKEWAVSSGIKMEFDATDQVWESHLELLRAEYNQDEQLIIIGDTEFDFVNTVGDKELRGVYYRYPEHQINEKLVSTVVAGVTEPGAEVTLYVNELKYKQTQAGREGDYSFTGVYLRNKRLNILRVVSEFLNGEKEETVTQLAGSRKIYEPDTEAVEVIAGWYQEAGASNWEGKIAGFKTRAADATKSFSWETVGQQEIDSPLEEMRFSSDLGLAFRVGRRTVIDSNLLAASRGAESALGFQGEVLYCLEQGYLAGDYFHIPHLVYLATPQREGQGGRLKGEWELAPQWTLNSLIGIRRAEVADDANRLQEVEAALNYHNTWQSSSSIAGRRERLFFPRDPLVEYIDRWGLILAGSKAKEGVRGEGQLRLFTNQLNSQQEEEVDYQDFSLKAEGYKKVFPSLAATVNLETAGSNRRTGTANLTLKTETKLKWNPWSHTFVSFRQELEGKEEKNKFTKRRSKSGVNITQYLNRSNIFNLGVNRSQSAASIDYDSYSLRLTKFWPDQEAEAAINWNWLVPAESDLQRQDTFQLEAEKLLADKKKFTFSLGKTFSGISAQLPEYFFRFSLAQAFGFAEEVVVPQEFRNQQHTSLITGYVYLDENNNQRKDPGEEVVPGIRMKLDNMTVKTDDRGQFRFNLTRLGEYSLNFDFNSLGADYTPVTEEKLVKVRKNENLSLNYGLTINGSAGGRIFIDQNANGKLDSGEEPLSWVGFSLNEGEKIVYTDKRGEFYLENIPLGRHELNILPDSLPAHMKPQGGVEYQIQITQQKLDAEKLLIPIIYDF